MNLLFSHQRERVVWCVLQSRPGVQDRPQKHPYLILLLVHILLLLAFIIVVGDGGDDVCVLGPMSCLFVLRFQTYPLPFFLL